MRSIIRNILFKIKYRDKVLYYKDTIISGSVFEGKNTVFSGTSVVNCSFGYGTYVQKNCNLVFTKVGRYCSIADNVHTCIGVHPTNLISTFPAFYYDTTPELGFTYHIGETEKEIVKYPDETKDYHIKIGNDVWIGSHAILMGGITIGDGAIIAAGSVVTRSVPPYSIMGGVPSRLIKYRFSDSIINRLTALKWWDKSEDWIIKNRHLFGREINEQTWEELNIETSLE